MNYFVTIVCNVTSGNAINPLGTAIASDSFLVSKQVFEMSEGRLKQLENKHHLSHAH